MGELLRDAEAEVAYSDPHVPTFQRCVNIGLTTASISLTPETLAGYDAVVLTTDHAKFDYDMIRASAQVIIDSQGVYQSSGENIIKSLRP